MSKLISISDFPPSVAVLARRTGGFRVSDITLPNIAVLGLLFAFLAGPMARADDLDAQFDAANKLYEEGQYVEAATAYGKLLRDGHATSAVYFNQGNAWFKAGQIGRAIVAYREAQRIAPRDPDLRANLRFARKQVNGEDEPAIPLYLRALRTLTINEWTGLCLAAAWTWFLLLAMGQWRPGLRRSLRTWKVVSGVCGALLLCAVWMRYHHDYLSNEGVVIVAKAEVRHGPLEESQTAYTARDGMELSILDHKDGWLQVRDRAGQLGWLAREDVLLLFGKRQQPAQKTPSS